MSYARASDKSHVYCYHSILGGYVTHVSGDAPSRYAGQSYNDKTDVRFHQRLCDLKKNGVKVPIEAINRIKREIQERT